MINKIKNDLLKYKNKKIKFRYNGSRNQIEEFEGVIKDCYENIILIDLDGKSKSFSYADVLTGTLEVDI